MRAFVAIFAREFRLRRMLVLGALIIGFIGPVFLGLTGQIAADSVSAVALLIGLLTCTLYALVLGSGAIARDLVDGRLGFDFVRPISGFSIWAGRIGAAVALLAISAVLVVAPALLFYPEPQSLPSTVVWFPSMDSMAGALAAGLLVCLTLLLLTHVVTVLFASRSASLVLDLAGLVAVGFWVNAALARLYRNWAQDAFTVGSISFLVLFLVVLIGATLAQLLVGRTDLARNHRALSIALWVPLLLGALALDAASRWVVSPKVGDLLSADIVSEAPAGSWFEVGGNLRHRGSLTGRFLIDAITGRVVRQGVSRERWSSSTTFSRDGRIAAWLSDSPKETEVRWTDLSASELKVEVAPISFAGVAEIPDLSPNGRWLAFRSDRRLLVFELRTGRLVNSVPITPDWDALRIRWMAEDRLRFWSAGGNVDTSLEPRISIAEIQVPGDPGKGAPVPVGRIPLPVHGYAWDVSRDGATVIVRENRTGTGRRNLFDGRTGAALGEINEGTRSGGFLLADGSVAIYVVRPERSLAIYDRTGILRRRFSKGLLFGAQPSPNTILASSTAAESSPGHPGPRHLWLLDLATGGMREIGRGWIPVSPTVGSGVAIVRTGRTDFARWDPATETLKPIVLR
ncbi:MAG TPA: hypothetical protein VGS22_04185 [Thermoanaerobaculia bacterium]|nr:hypothetical protein [Thermoanaerobaculia bacterium]